MARPVLTLTPRLRAMLAPAAKRGQHNWGKLEVELAAGRACIWDAGEGAVLTQVDAEGVCDVVLGGGRGARAWIGPMEAAIRTHPAHRDVKRYRIWGRKGWVRLFPHWTVTGFEDGLAVLESEAS